MNKIRVTVAIEPNKGLQLEYARKLKAMFAAFNQVIHAEAIKVYKSEMRNRGLATDGAPTAYMKRLLKRMARAKILLGEEARKVSYWYCRRMLFHVSRIQKRYLENAGVSKAIIRLKWDMSDDELSQLLKLDKKYLGPIKNKWHVPLIRGQYMSPDTLKGLEGQIKWMTELITKMSDASCKRLQATIKDHVKNGRSLSALTDTLRTMENMDDARAKRVALDQSCKLSQFVQMTNAKSLGIHNAIWIHVPGQWTSRPTHVAMNKKPFDLRQGMWDPDPKVQAFVQPGELPFCRCVFQLVLPDEILEKPNNAK